MPHNGRRSRDELRYTIARLVKYLLVSVDGESHFRIPTYVVWHGIDTASAVGGITEF